MSKCNLYRVYSCCTNKERRNTVIFVLLTFLTCVDDKVDDNDDVDDGADDIKYRDHSNRFCQMISHLRMLMNSSLVSLFRYC